MGKADKYIKPTLMKKAYQVFTDNEVNRIERELSITLSNIYKYYITSMGIPSHVIRAQSLPDVDIKLLTPDEVIKQTIRRHQMGMPKDLILIGRDSCGNGVCLNPTKDEYIYLFDHDLLAVYIIAENFEELMLNQDKEE
jgi:hypothetical protein